LDFPTGKYSLPQILFGLALSNTLLEISSDNDVLALSDILLKYFYCTYFPEANLVYHSFFRQRRKVQKLKVQL